MGNYKSNKNLLTMQEQNVFNLALRGLSATNIAAELQISRRTAEHHIEAIYKKLGITNRNQLLAYGYAYNYIQPPPISPSTQMSNEYFTRKQI